MLIQKLALPGDPHYAIISKMLFASHYFRAAIELQYLYPVRTRMASRLFISFLDSVPTLMR